MFYIQLALSRRFTLYSIFVKRVLFDFPLFYFFIPSGVLPFDADDARPSTAHFLLKWHLRRLTIDPFSESTHLGLGDAEKEGKSEITTT